MADITATLTGQVTITGELTVPMGIVPRGEIEVTENGEYDVTNYETANVAVPQPSGSVTITENGEHDVTDFVTADVQVPQPSGSIEITENGEFDVTDFESANVNVSGGGGADELAGLITRSIRTIELPNGIAQIGAYAFRGCSLLTKVDIPRSVQSFGAGAFYGCSNLREMYVRNQTPPNIGMSSTFNGMYSGCNIYVPADAVDAYKVASVWSSRASYIKAIPE